jgi:hypothetical protein
MRTSGVNFIVHLRRLSVVSSVPPPKPRRKRWVAAAERRLEPVALAALRVRVALDVARNAMSSADFLEDASAPLLAASADLLRWLRHAAVPEGYEDAVAELHAAAGVYRNAAVVYPGIPDLDIESREARSTACDAMLKQGEHHIAMFRTLVA